MKFSWKHLQPENNNALHDFTLLDASPITTNILAPGELIRVSGKFIKPTKIPGKNYSKDEVVIRNADSGKGELSLLGQSAVLFFHSFVYSHQIFDSVLNEFTRKMKLN